MFVYRISECRYNKDLNGSGAFSYGGLWNSKGVYILYTSTVSSLAMLETVARGISPISDYCLATIEIPEDKIYEIKEANLPRNWFEAPAPDNLKKIGDQFILENKYLALTLPSAVFRTEKNILINPSHRDFSKIKLLSSKKISIDGRLMVIQNE